MLNNLTKVTWPFQKERVKHILFSDFERDVNIKSLPFHHVSTTLLDIFPITHNRYWWSPQCHNTNPFLCVRWLKLWVPCCCLPTSAVDAVFLLLKLAGVLSLWKGFTPPLSLTCTQHQSSHSLGHWSSLQPGAPRPELRNKRLFPFWETALIHKMTVTSKVWH